MKTSILLIILFSLSIILSSCDSGGNNNGQPKECTEGIKGITAKFVSGSIQEHYSIHDNFNILIDILNNGATSSEYILRVGHSPDLFSVTYPDKHDDFSLEPPTSGYGGVVRGKDRTNDCRGGFDKISVQVDAKNLPIGLPELDDPFSIAMCYRYTTNFTETVCLDPNPSEINAINKVCQSQEQRFSKGQGAPISISKIGAPIINNEGKAKFRVHLRNNGNGKIIASKEKNNINKACTLSSDTFFDFAHVKGFLDQFDLECGLNNPPPDRTPIEKIKLWPDANVELVHGDEVVYKDLYFDCITTESVNDDISSATTMTLNLNINYFYFDTTDTKTVTLRGFT